MNNELEGKEFQFVDAHVHFYDMIHPRLQYDHWQPGRDHPFLGAQTRKLGGRNYTAFDFHEEYCSRVPGFDADAGTHLGRISFPPTR